jgi:hypothetical protein
LHVLVVANPSSLRFSPTHASMAAIYSGNTCDPTRSANRLIFPAAWRRYGVLVGVPIGVLVAVRVGVFAVWVGDGVAV